MTSNQIRRLEKELGRFCEELTQGLGRSERREALGLYISGLLLDGERKSIQPMASRWVSEASAQEAMRQRLQQSVVVAKWAEATVYGRIGKMAEAKLGKMDAFVLDDTGFAKKGTHSVGVARQYSGTLGRVDNCQVATSLHLAADAHSVCVGQRLFVPEEWVNDDKRRKAAGIPQGVQGKRKWELGLELLDNALEAGLCKRVTLADAGYGDATEFREGLQARGLDYVVAVSGVPTIWKPGIVPEVPQACPNKRGPRVKRVTAEEEPMSLADFVATVPEKRFHQVSWRQGSKGVMKGQFYATRVYSAERRTKKNRPALAEVWLLIERTNEVKRPYKFYFSNLPENTPTQQLVRFAKLRWRIERDYQEMKGELGLDHFEGRTWSGFHHHAALCAAAHAFLTFQRKLFPPALALLACSGQAHHPNHRLAISR